MGTVTVSKSMGGEGLPELTPWSVEVRQPSRYDKGYAYFDVSDLLVSGGYCMLLAVVSGVSDGVYGGPTAALYPGRVYNGSAQMGTLSAIKAHQNDGYAAVIVEDKSTSLATVASGELKVHLYPDTTTGTYTAQGGFLLVLRH